MNSATFFRIYAVVVHVFAVIFGGTLLSLFLTASDPSILGIAGWFARGAGTVVIAFIIGLLGLLNKSSRLSTFFLVSWVVFVLIVIGSLAQL